MAITTKDQVLRFIGLEKLINDIEDTLEDIVDRKRNVTNVFVASDEAKEQAQQIIVADLKRQLREAEREMEALLS